MMIFLNGILEFIKIIIFTKDPLKELKGQTNE